MLPEFLHHLPELAKQQIVQQATAVRWTKGQQVVQAQEPVSELFMVQSGSVRLYQLERGAREVTVSVLLAGELLGCGILAGEGHHTLNAEALEDVAALRLGKAQLAQCLREYPALGAALRAQMVRQTRSVQQRLAQLVFMEVSQRLALALLELLARQPLQAGELIERPVELQGRVSHQDLAYVVGSTRETITKLLGDFRARGYLELGYRRIIIISRSGLEKAAAQPLETLG